MDSKDKYKTPFPIVDNKENALLDDLTKRYDRLIQPGFIHKLGAKAGQFIPGGVKEFANGMGAKITEAEIFAQIMNLLGTGFNIIEEEAAKHSIKESSILARINKVHEDNQLESLDEICLVRSYDLSKIVNDYRSQDTLAAFVEGGGTGLAGFWGIPFNIVLSTFLYFRAVQSVAMFYGYDVKHDSAEMVIASTVFTNSLSPSKSGVNNDVSSVIAKIMVMSNAAVVKQTAKKTWSDMAAKGGIPLILTQMRALANKSAQKALQKAGEKGLENSLFKEAFEQIGRKLTLKSVGKAVPVVSGVFGACIDTAQMRRVLDYADIFYHKRFLLEKEERIKRLMNCHSVVKS